MSSLAQMMSSILLILIVVATATPWDVRPFNVNISARVPHMLDLVERTQLPNKPIWPGVGSTAGIDLGLLKSLGHEWLHRFDWQAEESRINQYDQFIVTIEGLRLHYVHEKSTQPDAIPLLILHGWPGSFLEFIPVIRPLTQEANTSTGTPVSFDVIVPSLPGFDFSSPAPANWTINDTARVLNTLMTEVLGYKTFAVSGSDWGSGPAYILYENYIPSVKALHAPFLPFTPPTPSQLMADNITLTPLESFEEQRQVEWENDGTGYFVEQTTKPNTIGLALEDNPVGQLAWIAEKFISWSDPRAGTGPSVLTHNEILRSVSLYYLTQTFTSAAFIYYQNPNAFRTNYTSKNVSAPLLFSAFKYNVGFWPPTLVAKIGNLTYYRNHKFGGHFPGLDNPPALIHDLREIRDWYQ